MMCLTCGYRRRAMSGAPDTVDDKAHKIRCDFAMTIRYRTRNGITGGSRRR